MTFRLTEIPGKLKRTVAWRLHRVLGDKVVYGTLLECAKRWRQLLSRPTYIAVIGSAGKTTAKELLLGMLSHQGRGVGNPGSFNNIEEIAMAMLRLRPWHSFFVSELSEDRPGVMDRNLALLRPTIGIVTVVKDDHLAAFASRDALAAEMVKLVASLPANGTALLNADDERVLAMATHCAAKVITYGISPKADLRADDISSVWPDRLQLTLVHGAERVRLATQLCGTHWIPSVLGAIGCGLATGMTLEECAAGIATVKSFEGRMQPVTTPDGITFIRDDFKAPLWTLDACFDFMKAARAKRKIIVIGTLSDYGTGTGASRKYADVARLAQEIADITLFVGPWASSVLKTRKPGHEDALRTYVHVRDATQYVNSIVREGDLVLLKGTTKQDHLLRIILARSNQVNCWQDDCARGSFCNECPDRMEPSGAPPFHQQLTLAQAAVQHSDVATLEPSGQVIVGLGNPEAKYSNTPHNIGYAAVEHLAESLHLEWIAMPQAWLARGVVRGQSICLIKVNTNMNLIGGALKKLSDGMSFNPQQCILVYDDLDLGLGTVRTRLSGSAGGHRGVASILEAFQTDAFRRVKVGFALPGQDMNRGELVLRQFDAAQRGAVDAALELAQAALHTLLKNTEIVRKR